MNIYIYFLLKEPFGQQRETQFYKVFTDKDLVFARVPVAGDEITLNTPENEYCGSDPITVEKVQLDFDGEIHINIETIVVEGEFTDRDEEYIYIHNMFEKAGYEVSNHMNWSEIHARMRQGRLNAS